MINLIGDYGKNQGVQDLFNGSAPIDMIATNEYEKALLSELKFVHPSKQCPKFSSAVTLKAYTYLFNNTKERTASSPSGAHIGHYKVGEIFPEISEILAIMMSLPFVYGFSPTRWRQSVHFIIEKIQGNMTLGKLRIIQLLEEDFNGMLKIKIGRQLMHELENSNTLGDNIYGGRSGRSAHNALLTQCLVCDNLNQKKNNVVAS